MSQFTNIGNGFYLVRSAEGFDKAIEHFDNKTNPDLNIAGKPLTYPSIVCLSIHWDGSKYYIDTKSISSNHLIETILNSDIALRNKHEKICLSFN